MNNSRASLLTGVRPRRDWLVPASIFAAVSVVHLVAQLLHNNALSSITQVFLMPALMATVWAATRAPRGRLVQLLLLAQFFSWLGDAVPRLLHGDLGFLMMVLFFLVAQVIFAVALWPYWRASIIATPVWLLLYAFALGGLIILCGPNAGVLLTPVIFYGFALTVTAVLSTGLGFLAGIGGAVFFVSDSLIALRSFGDFHLPAHGFLIMATYIAAQAILAIALVRAAAREYSATHSA